MLYMNVTVHLCKYFEKIYFYRKVCFRALHFKSFYTHFGSTSFVEPFCIFMSVCN